MKYDVVYILNGNVLEWEAIDMKQVYKLGASLTRACKRNKLKMRFKVYSKADGKCLLRFYNMPVSRSEKTDVARLSAFCKYGRACNGIDY